MYLFWPESNFGMAPSRRGEALPLPVVTSLWPKYSNGREGGDVVDETSQLPCSATRGCFSSKGHETIKAYISLYHMVALSLSHEGQRVGFG